MLKLSADGVPVDSPRTAGSALQDPRIQTAPGAFQLLFPKSKHLLLPFQVLFGLLTGTENQYTSRGGALSSQEQHNILPLASSQIR